MTKNDKSNKSDKNGKNGKKIFSKKYCPKKNFTKNLSKTIKNSITN